MPQPNLQQVPPFYHNYIKLVPHHNLMDAFNLYTTGLLQELQNLPDEKWSYRYADGKWSIKEMVQHIMDTDRIFCYRALAIARGEKASLPGFDENAYAVASAADNRQPESLLTEYRAVQQSTVLLFQSFQPEHLLATGVANGKAIDVNAIGYITIGHTLHHKNILQERYL